MSTTTAPRWHAMRTDETRQIETLLREQFPDADAYRYNSAVIRVRVVDKGFEGRSVEERDALVEPLLRQLPESTQRDILNLMTFTPDELKSSLRPKLLNLEFEDPSESQL